MRPARLQNLAIADGVPALAAGVFFGNSCRAVKTPSFQFSEVQATVPERKVPRHRHEAPHFILVTEGMYATEARNQKALCAPGALIFNPGDTTHRDCFRSKKGKFLSISPGPSASLLLDRASPVPLIIEGEGFRLLDDRPIGDRIVRELQLKAKLSSQVLEGLGLELLGHLARLEERAASRFAPTWLLQAREMIEDCCEHDVTIAELAALAGVHPVYLARAHRRYFGCSPGEYLRLCRQLQVRGLVSGTDLPLVDVALRCGFSDQSQMTRSFTSSFGIPPGRYRRLRRQ